MGSGVACEGAAVRAPTWPPGIVIRMDTSPAPIAVGSNGELDGLISSSLPISSVTVERLGASLVPPARQRLSGERLAVLASVAGVGAIVLGGVAMATTIHATASGKVADSSGAPSALASATAPTAGSRAVSGVAFLARATTQRIPFAGSGGRAVLAVGPSGNAVLVLDGLAPAPKGASYVAWVLGSKGATVGRAAVFSGRDALVTLTRLVPVGGAVGITVERDPAARPRGAPRLIARRNST